MTDEATLQSVERELERETLKAARRDVVDAALANARVVLVEDAEQAAEAANDLAPEHLHLAVADPSPFARSIRNAGAIFVGPATAVPFGDYGVASNHVLPTAGTARFASGLRASDFVKVMPVVEMSAEAAARFAPEVALIATTEGLAGHARSVEARAEDRGDPA